MSLSALALVLSLSTGQFGTGGFPTGRVAASIAASTTPKVCIIGDSLAVGAPYAANPFPTRLGEYLGPGIWLVQNFAVGGTRSDAIRDSYFTQIRGQSRRCTVLLVEGGTNTVVDGTEGIGATAWWPIQTAAAGALDDGLRVVLNTIPPRSAGPGYTLGVQTGLDVFNAWARAFAAADPSRVVLVDLAVTHADPILPLRLRVSSPSYDAGDGLHMTQAGQDKWACDVAKLLKPSAACP